MQNGQTEPAGVSLEGVRRYAEWFGLFVVKNIKNKGTTISRSLHYFKILNFLFLTVCAKCDSLVLLS